MHNETADFLPRTQFDALFAALLARAYDCVGPTLRDGTIRYLPIGGPADLPQGVHDLQAPGSYRVERDAAPRCFAWANGPEALKPLTFRSREVLWESVQGPRGQEFVPQAVAAPRLAVIGVRACDLAALALQRRHFLGQVRDPGFAARADALFLVAVHCSAPSANCFCAATGDGPSVQRDFDIVLHELDDGFLVAAGSAPGEAVLRDLPLVDAGAARRSAARAEQRQAVECQRRSLPQGLRPGALIDRLDSPAWNEVAQRCLACGNCTAVCPTCFCHAQYDVPAVDGRRVEHVREWDSCFSDGHSEIHGFQVRGDTRLRYRQWATHKFDTWHAQAGRGGCVGCGRCISWCPVGIDVTEVLHAVCAD